MKVLYCNPIFLDYRLPFYKRLNELFDGNFYVMYSTTRYKMRHNEHLLKQIPEVLGRNALPFENENSSILMKCLSKDIMVKRENEFLSQKDCTEALKI